MAKILAIEDGKATPLEQVRFTEEGKLQDYLEQHPDLIPVEDIDENTPPLLCIGREVGVSSGSVDLLFIDRDGTLTVVETKLAKNPEARRTVVGQIVEYASYIYSWTVEEVYRVADEYLSKPGNAPSGYEGYTLDEVMMEFTGGEFSGEVFRGSIEQNLQNGRIRLLIAVDELVEPLRATVAFLNRNSKFDIFLLQVRSFGTDKKETLIPTLFGQGQKQGPSTAKAKPIIDESIFLACCREGEHKRAEELYLKAKALAEKRRAKGDHINWGVTGHSYKLSHIAEVPFVNYPNGWMQLWLYAVENHGEAGQRYLEKLRTISDFGTKVDLYGKHKAPFFLTDRMTPEDIDAFISAIEELGEALDTVRQEQG